MTLNPGEKVGVVGRTGAGKSTLVQTILRLYPVQSGAVLVDGVDVASVGLKTLRGRVAIVPQAPTLFAGTIRFNLDMFGERTDEELEAALASRLEEQLLAVLAERKRGEAAPAPAPERQRPAQPRARPVLLGARRFVYLLARPPGAAQDDDGPLPRRPAALSQQAERLGEAQWEESSEPSGEPK